MDDLRDDDAPEFTEWLDGFGPWQWLSPPIADPGSQMPCAGGSSHARIAGRGHADGGADLYLALMPEDDFDRQVLGHRDGLKGPPQSFVNTGMGGLLTARHAGVERLPGEVIVNTGMEMVGAEAFIANSGVAKCIGGLPLNHGIAPVMLLADEHQKVLGIDGDGPPAAMPAAERPEKRGETPSP